MAEQPVTIEKAGRGDVSRLLPLMRAYCEFYEVEPKDSRLVALARALADDRSRGVQYLAQGTPGIPLGFATVFWTYSTLAAGQIGVMNDLYVVEEARGRGIGRALIDHCRAACRERGALKLEWSTAPDNHTAQKLYDSTGAESSSWITYELDAW